jgi:hypothetical protein
MNERITEKLLDIKAVVVDGSVVIRHTDKNTVERYKETSDLPPIDVYEIDVPAGQLDSSGKKMKAHKAFVLADGLHRFTAAKSTKGRKQIAARVHQGTLDDAKTFAVMANLKHGLPLNEKARYEAIRRYAALHPTESQRDLAKTFNCSAMTINRAMKPKKAGVHVAAQGRATVVPTGPKAAKTPGDIVQALVVVLEVVQQNRANIVTHITKATPREVQVRLAQTLDIGGNTIVSMAHDISEALAINKLKG